MYYIIGIGSNSQKDLNLTLAQKLLESSFPGIRFSRTMETKPILMPCSDDFVNRVAVCYTEMTFEKVNMLLKSIEKTIGRTPEDKKNGVIKIDLDILVCDGKVIRAEDWNREFRKELVEINEDGTIILK